MKTLSVALLIILGLTACGPPAPVVRPDSPSDPALAEISSLARAGQLEQAAAGWLALAEERPSFEHAYRLNAVELLIEAGQQERAGELLEIIDRSALGRREQQRLTLAQVELDLHRGELASAGWRLAELADSLPADLESRRVQLEARLREHGERPAAQALSALDQAIRAGDFTPELGLALLIELPLADLERLQFEHGHRPELEPWLALATRARAHALDPAALTVALDDWESDYPNVGYSAEAARFWLTLWRQTRPLPARIGVILPGRAAMVRAGNAVREGMLSAWLEIPPERRPELLFRYIGEDHQDVISAWFDLREAGVDFLVGPLEREQVDALASLPNPGLPVLLLNHPSANASLDPATAFRAFALLPEDDAELAAAHALVSGHERALVLHQNSDWGRRVSATFSELFELGGGEVIGSAEYSTRQVDHSALLEVLLELDRSEQRIARLARTLNQPIESEPQRRSDVDVVFLAARAEDGRQIRPQLRFFGAGDVPVLGTSQIIAGAPDPARDGDLDGVVLPMPPWFLDFTAQGQQRVRAANLYPHMDNPNLARLHAMGADAIALLPWLDALALDPDLYLAGLTGRLRLADGILIERDQPMVRLVQGRAELAQ